ncbi:MAG TPA: OmcA/MtrC family decaheme c-type cytochrome [Gallionellaceae bacterium]|nr:OmcA/MtrC family decaheme c-type cytochrome [Gallionellaceae bacterium]
MKTTFIRLGLFALIVAAVAGCSGSSGSAGAAGTNGTSYLVKVGDNSVTPTADAVAAWKALAPQVTITGVTISSQPVVNFTVKDAAGNSVVGLGNKSKSTSATVASLTNIGFTLARLVPVTGGPSKWVSYNVVRPLTVAETTAVPASSSCNAAKTWCGTFPALDNQGTLVDNGDGSYQYTFLRDPRQAAAIVAGLTDSADGLSKKSDLGDVGFNASQTHRLGIQIGGNAPGTGSNTPTAVTATPGVAMVNTANIVYDFRPDGGAISNTRDIVKIDSCSDCHKGKVLAHGSRKDPKFCVTCHTDQIRFSFSQEASSTNGGLTLNGATRQTTAVVDGRALGNYPNLIHKMHMGEELIKQGYFFNAEVKFNEVKFPQDQRNCTKCHDGAATDVNKKTANGDNWKNLPSRLACGACHDGINFAAAAGAVGSITLADRDADVAANVAVGTTHTGHQGGIQADDSMCSSCHTAAAMMVTHIPVTPPDSNNALLLGGTNSNTNAAWVASNTSNLPAGAIKVTYDIKSVSRNASLKPVMVFRMLQDGARVDFNTYSAGVTTELWNNFMGAPSVYFVFAVPQDGIAAPADFNASASSYLRSLWNGTATNSSSGTLTGPDGSGYYTATLTGVNVPDNAVMLTGGLGYSYAVKTTLPLTQTNLAAYPVVAATGSGLTTGMPNKTGGLIVVAPDAQKVASTGAAAGGTGGAYSGRRAIVEDARCNKCHQELGVFVKETFHAAQRNDGSTCSWCHNPNRASSGWTADSTNHIHAIHAGYDPTGVGTTVGGKDKRVNKFTWHAASTTDGFWGIGFPGVLKNCETCHLPGTYDFSAAASASALPNRLYRTVATGIFNGTAGVVNTAYSYSGGVCVAGTTAQTAEGAFALSPYVTKDNATSYGLGFSFNAGLTTSNLCPPAGGAPVAVAAGATYPADAASLVDSPIAAVCFACHDTDMARLHMESNGGSIYAQRPVALAKPEQCIICHGTGKIADIKAMHDK